MKSKTLFFVGLLLLVLAAMVFSSAAAQTTTPPEGWDTSGHADKTAEAFRHWDEEEGKMVPGGCAKCHTATGLPLILTENVVIYPNPPAANKASQSLSQPASDGLACATCHQEDGKNYFVQSVIFPSGASAWFNNAGANLCLNCHQGRESSASVDAVIARVGADKALDKVAVDKEGKPTLNFRNPHYFAAGATFFGDQTKGMYQFKGQKYNGISLHPEPMNNCVACHDQHSLELKLDDCATCHGEQKTVDDLQKIRAPKDVVDYDGDKDTTEGFAGEIATMQEKLLAAIQAYALKTAKAGIVYDPATYPYFFIDTNADGKADAAEIKSENAFTAWTPKLLQAAYNYQYSQKDPGAFAHNFHYVQQALYDSIKAMGGATTGMTRAKVTVNPMPEKPVPPEN